MYCVKKIVNNAGLEFKVQSVREVGGCMYLQVKNARESQSRMVKIKDIKFGAAGFNHNKVGYYVNDAKNIVNGKRTPCGSARIVSLSNGTLLAIVGDHGRTTTKRIHVSEINFGMRHYDFPLRAVTWDKIRRKWIMIKKYLDKWVVDDINLIMMSWYWAVWNANRSWCLF